MKTRSSYIAALAMFCAPAAAAAAPAVIVVTPPPSNVIKVTGQNPPSITITRPVTEIVNVLTPGQQGPAGPAGPPSVHGNRNYLDTIDQSLSTTATPTFGNVRTTGTLSIGTESYDTAVITQQASGGLSFVSPPNDPQTNGISYIYDAKGWNDGSIGKAFQVRTGGSPQFTINGNGNVGIGTTNPGSRLDVKSTGLGNEGIRLMQSSGANTLFSVLEGATFGQGILRLGSGGGTSNIEFNGNGASYFIGGNVGIGTAIPEYPLHIESPGAATAWINSTGNNGRLFIGSQANGESMIRFYNGGNSRWGVLSRGADNTFVVRDELSGIDRLSIDTAGNVGINGTPLATVATSGSYTDLTNSPAFTRGYDGREIELQTSATHIQWRYVADPPGPWTNLVLLADLAGTDGTNGVDGRSVLNGAGVPSNAFGADGDFYIDTQFIHMYGPKAAGAWPGTYIELVGPQGEPGPPGPAGNVDSASVRGALDDPIDGAVVWVQQGPTEAATEPKRGVRDRDGNAKQWVDGNGTVIRQCITADSAPAFKMIAPGGAVIYTVSCDNTMTFTGTVTIK